jgi:hypothetical protein
MRQMLVHFLSTVQAAHVSFLDEGAFERLSEPTTRGTRRLAGIDLNKARNRHMVDASRCAFHQARRLHAGAVGRSRTAALRSGCQHLFGAQRCLRFGKTARQDAGPCDRVATQSILMGCGPCVPTSSYARRSSSRCWPASCVPTAAHPRSPAPLDQHYVTLREELHRTFETIGLAAA